MDQDSLAVTNLSDAANRLNRSDLVVGMHNAYQTRVRSDGGFNVIRRHDAIFITLDHRHFATQLLHKFRWLTNSRVLDCRNHQVRRSSRLSLCNLSASQHDSFDRKIVTLRSPAGENNFIAITAQEERNFGTSIFDRLRCSSAERVAAGWVTVVASQKRLHRFHDTGRNGCGRVVVQINLLHDFDPESRSS